MAAIRVLVVDDSAFARKVVREVLSGGEGLLVVGIARDGLDALEKIASLKPDVVTLDLNMPDLDGVGVLRALAGLPHKPAVVVVSMSDGDSDLGIQALAEGAFDVVHKPTALATDRLYDLADELRTKVRAAARHGSSPPPRLAAAARDPPPKPPTAGGQTTLVVVGASTGGPQAISSILRALPRDFSVPMAIVLHMPEGYTEAFARRLDRDVALDVIEARDGMALRPGLVVIARAGMHLTIHGAPGAFTAKLAALPDNLPHRPSVDELFRSAAAVAGQGTLAVVLTGMGEDGLAGARAIGASGGTILTESESSAVVYGMPRAVFEAGLATAEAPLTELPALITRCI